MSIEDTIRDVLAGHYPDFDEHGHINGTVPGRGAWDCWCGLVLNDTNENVRAHVAGEVAAALQLREEWAESVTGSGYVHGRYESEQHARESIARRAAMYPNPKRSEPVRRYVTEWTTVPRDGTDVSPTVV